jgi:hypothetical protein
MAAGRKSQRSTKCLSWRPDDEAALRRLRARVAAEFGAVFTERDIIAAAVRLALRDPAGLGLARPVG